MKRLNKTAAFNCLYLAFLISLSVIRHRKSAFVNIIFKMLDSKRLMLYLNVQWSLVIDNDNTLFSSVQVLSFILSSNWFHVCFICIYAGVYGNEA